MQPRGLEPGSYGCPEVSKTERVPSSSVIRNTTVFDGSGGPPFPADVLIEGEFIAEIGTVIGDAEVELDGTGMALAPGFIDVHTHDDFAALVHPDMSFKSRGGVTTCIVGNCGFGAAPWEAASSMARMFHPNDVFPVYEGFAGYLRHLEQHPPGVNVGVLAGHGTIRLAAMGTERRPPDEREMRAMKSVVEEGLEAGVLGMSTGLIYEPGRYAATEELIELASIMSGVEGIYASHIRDEGAGLLDAVSEAIRIGSEAEVAVQISHHKVTGRANWGLVSESLGLIETAQRRGQVVHADQYPYTAGSTSLAAVVQNEMFGDDGKAEASGDDVVVAACAARPEWEGLSIATLAQRWEVLPSVAAARVIQQDAGTSVVIHSMNESDVQTVLSHPSTMVGSDGIPTLDGKPHPRLYNTFARVLGHYGRELGVLSMAEAIRRMTSYSADVFGLVDRGRVEVGHYADLVVFDPETVIDRGTFEDPNQYPSGISTVFVNGVEVVRDATHTGALPGRGLRRAG